MTKYIAAGIVLLALACADKDAGQAPMTAPDAGHRFVEREEPAKPADDRDTATRPQPGTDAAEGGEPAEAPDELERAANHGEEAVPPPAEIH